MKVGDLVKIKAYCKNGGELGVVMQAPNCIKCAKIILMKTGQTVSSLTSNLEIL